MTLAEQGISFLPNVMEHHSGEVRLVYIGCSRDPQARFTARFVTIMLDHSFEPTSTIRKVSANLADCRYNLVAS